MKTIYGGEPLYEYMWVNAPVRSDGKVNNDLIKKWFRNHNIECKIKNLPYDYNHKIEIADEDYIFLTMKYL